MKLQSLSESRGAITKKEFTGPDRGLYVARPLQRLGAPAVCVLLLERGEVVPGGGDPSRRHSAIVRDVEVNGRKKDAGKL